MMKKMLAGKELQGLGEQAARVEGKQGYDVEQSLILLICHRVTLRAATISEVATSSGARN